jgi:hypothetical protein
MENMVRWGFGFVIGAAWSTVNLYSTVSILKIGVLKKAPAKLSALILLKFPVLYLVGFAILMLKIFPPMSLLAGLTAALVAIGIFKLWPKQA